MRRRAALAAPLLALPFLAPPRPAASQACRRTVIADLPLRLVDSYPVVPATLAGHPVSFIVDTGAQGMLVTPAIAAALALPLNGMARIDGTSGSQETRIVALPGLRLAGAPMPGLLAPVAELPVALAADPPLAGLLGALLLSRFDVAFDIPAARLTLFQPGECPPPTGLALPMDVSPYGEATIPVRVAGTPLRALIDTGSRATLLRQATARRLGLSATPSASTAGGIGGARQLMEQVTLPLALGDAPPEPAPISITPLALDADLLLGTDRLLRRSLYLSYVTRTAVFGPAT